MNESLKFARLDYITIKPYLTLKNLAILLPLLASFTYFTGNPGTMIGILMMYGTVYASFPFAVGDKSGIDMLYTTLPLRRRSVVCGRYVFALCLSAALGVASFGLSAVLSRPFKPEEVIITVLACFFVFTALLAVQLPIYFALGYPKAKPLAYLPLAAFPAAIMAAGALVGEDRLIPFASGAVAWLESNALAALAAATLMWSAAIVLSAALSKALPQKRILIRLCVSSFATKKLIFV